MIKLSLTQTKWMKYLLLGLVCSLISFFWFRDKSPHPQPRDYAAISAEGVIRVATEYNSVSYFATGDSMAGFNYELIQAFARSKELKAEIIPEMSFEKRLQGLANGTFDVIAYGIQTTSEFKDSLLFTAPISLSKQVLVQRKLADGKVAITSQLGLAGKTLHLIKGSPAVMRIKNLGNEIGDTIYIKEVDKYGTEQLLAMVEHGDIDYAVCDEEIARASVDSFPQIDISTGISFNQFNSWAVSKQSPALRDSLNNWIKSFMKTKDFKKIYRSYYKKD
ncbi:transporter substrate-binding domain-containing protein [Bacteroides graminisolvens]|nr:transporter substrate-binding domain-containing protein [Bacteroides graminisolvens]